MSSYNESLRDNNVRLESILSRIQNYSGVRSYDTVEIQITPDSSHCIQKIICTVPIAKDEVGAGEYGGFDKGNPATIEALDGSYLYIEFTSSIPYIHHLVESSCMEFVASDGNIVRSGMENGMRGMVTNATQVLVHVHQYPVLLHIYTSVSDPEDV